MASPAPSQSSNFPASSLARKADGAPRRVLYAEDQVSSRIVTKAMLEKMGFLVDAVDDGEVAVELARESQYDIILLDIEMPIMDGVTAARMIRAEIAACKDIPILALSAFLADSTEHTQWRDAFDSAVPKPANSNELQRAMVQAMSMHQVALGELSTLPLVSVSLTIWESMKDGLPKGILAVLANTATGEMQHQALAMAAACEADDRDALRRYRHALKGLALNFGVDQLAAMITATTEEPRTIDLQAVFSSIDQWNRANSTL